MSTDYLGREDLLDMGLDEAAADAVLAQSDLTGHDKRKVIEADRLNDVRAMLNRTDEM